MITDSPVIKRMVELGEDQLNKITQQLLSNETFTQAVQSVVNNSLKAKGVVDKHVRIALSAMSLPSTDDVESLKNKLDSLEQSIDRIEKSLQKLSEKNCGCTHDDSEQA